MAASSAKDKRIAELEAALETVVANQERAVLEVKNCHILMAVLVGKLGGGVAITDHQLQNYNALGVLMVMREERIPGCVMVLNKPPLQ
jgi:hypothetical protein